MGKLPLLDVPIVDYGEAEDAMVRYRQEGEARAAALGNRGPLRFDAGGRVDQAILDAYEEHGFYVFTGVLGQDELEALKGDVSRLLNTTSEGIFDTTRNRAEALADQIKAALNELGETLGEQEDNLESVISERPITSLASAFALGVVVGFMLRRH